jgi:hypothetical protein
VLRNGDRHLGFYIIIQEFLFFEISLFFQGVFSPGFRFLSRRFLDIIFFQDVFFRQLLFSKDFMSTLGFESDFPSMEWSADLFDYENLSNILIRVILST